MTNPWESPFVARPGDGQNVWLALWRWSGVRFLATAHYGTPPYFLFADPVAGDTRIGWEHVSAWRPA